MDLHTVADIVEEHAIEAHNAFHAGHPETSYKYFKVIMEQIRTFFNEMSPKEVATLEETTNEKLAQVQKDTPAKALGGSAQPAAVDPAGAAQQIGHDSQG